MLWFFLVFFYCLFLFCFLICFCFCFFNFVISLFVWLCSVSCTKCAYVSGLSPFLIACPFIIRTFLIHHFYSVCYKNNTKVGTHGAGTAYPSVAPGFATFFICLSAVRVVAIVKLHVLTCFVPSCDVHYDFPIKRFPIRLDLCLILCFVNVIWMSSHILASSKIFISDVVRVIKSNTMGITCGAELLSISEYPSSPLICRGVHVSRSLVFCLMFCKPLFLILSFFFVHCIVCHSNYGFWLSLWYHQTLLGRDQLYFVFVFVFPVFCFVLFCFVLFLFAFVLCQFFSLFIVCPFSLL